jgi:hypothetical protein
MTRLGSAIVVVLAAGWPANASAGQADDERSSRAITVSDARTPEAPAFVLLGVSPTQIERPTTPRALTISVVSASLNSDNLFPQNYALQVSPYWLKGHPALTSREYYQPSIAQSLVQRLSVSVATTRISISDGSKTNATQLGFGAYTAIAAGHAGPEMLRLIARIHAVQLEVLAARFALDSNIPTPTEGPPPDPTYQAIVDTVTKTFDATAASSPTPEQAQAYAAARRRLIARLARMWNETHRDPAALVLRSAASALVDEIERDLARAVRAVRRADESRRGFQLAVAGASAWTFPDTGAADRSLARWGFWATPSYRFDAVPMELIGVVRGLRRPGVKDDTFLDFGGRITQQTSVLNWSAEYVGRSSRSGGARRQTTERAAAVFEVRAHDDAYITATIGKDFADRARGKSSGSLFTTLALALGFGEKPTITVQ